MRIFRVLENTISTSGVPMAEADVVLAPLEAWALEAWVRAAPPQRSGSGGCSRAG